MTSERGDIRSYDYRFRGWSLLFTAFFLLVSSAMMLVLAKIDPDSFIGIPLASGMGSLLYIASAAGLAALFGILFVRTRSQKGSNRDICFEAHQISLPKSLYSNARVTIPYRSITSVELQSLRRSASQAITINYDNQSVLIADLGFETKAEFHKVYDQLQKRRSGSS